MKKWTSFSAGTAGRILLAGSGTAAFLYFMDIGCLFRFFFGIPCPGCGMTRAIAAACRLDFITAFYYHPLFWLMPVLLILEIWNPKFLHTRWCSILLWAILGVVLLIYGIRMMYLFPNWEPMKFNPDAVLFRLFRALFGEDF